jgi:hypothetical protein
MFCTPCTNVLACGQPKAGDERRHDRHDDQCDQRRKALRDDQPEQRDYGNRADQREHCVAPCVLCVHSPGAMKHDVKPDGERRPARSMHMLSPWRHAAALCCIDGVNPD